MEGDEPKSVETQHTGKVRNVSSHCWKGAAVLSKSLESMTPRFIGGRQEN